jgi:pyruvate-ferredoxin/flavodoxin oxidoreductase
VEALKNVKSFSVIERLDIPMGQSNPLTSEIKAAFADALNGMARYPKISSIPKILSGVYGLGSRDVRPGDLIAIYKNMQATSPREFFALGIKHPLALDGSFDPDLRPKGSFSMRGHSVGGYGSVTTNKIIASIVGDLFDLYVQAYPKYGSEKKGLPTTYYLTIATEPVKVHSELNDVEFVPVNDVNAFNQGNPLFGLKEGGMVFIQTHETEAAKVWEHIPEKARKNLVEKKLRVLALDTVKIARELAPSGDLVQRMQGIVLLGIFLKCTPFMKAKGISTEDLYAGVEKSLRKYFGKRGENVIQANMSAVKRGFSEVLELP